jgi:hypothetical protein
MVFKNSEEAPAPHMLFRAIGFLWESAQNPQLRNVGLFLASVGVFYYGADKLVPAADDNLVELMLKQMEQQ